MKKRRKDSIRYPKEKKLFPIERRKNLLGLHYSGLIDKSRS
uniref:Uncharacterized protein n=1 Tax=Bacteriophage sp. TaxID=38018 RepID=A0A8D9UHS3_9VIRU|nr:MAG TPA: hypothetical protein [Bacteriophage sp.]